jgi:hypothetical protein
MRTDYVVLVIESKAVLLNTKAEGLKAGHATNSPEFHSERLGVRGELGSRKRRYET